MDDHVDTGSSGSHNRNRYDLSRLKTRVTKWVWGDTTGEERKLVRKLDFFILTYSCISYFFNKLDRAAFANAYVAGLKEALQLEGNQYNILLSMVTAGMLIGQVPNGLIIQKVAPRIWLPSMVLLWAALTALSAACRTFTQLCVVRFFQGLAESSTYAGCMYVMGSWYKADEISMRTAVLTISGQVGNMCAGALMAAIHASMDGRSGLDGWQWVFIIDGIITCPIAFYGYFFFPDLPETTKAPYLKKLERDLALNRIPAKKADGHDISPLSLTKRVLGQPTFYICCGFSVLGSALQAYHVQGLMLLYLKARQTIDGWSQAQINTLPLGTQALAIVVELLAATVIDKSGRRLATGLGLCLIQLVCTVVLLIPKMTVAGNLGALYLSSTSNGINPLLYGWSTIIASRGGDDAARSTILAGMVASDMLLWTFWGIVLYSADDAPYWKNGYIAMVCVVSILSGWLFVVRWLDRFTIRKHADRPHLPQTAGYVLGVQDPQDSQQQMEGREQMAAQQDEVARNEAQRKEL